MNKGPINTYQATLRAQQLLSRAEKKALEKMQEEGYVDPRLTQTIKGTGDEYDMCKRYDDRLAFYRQMALDELDKEMTVNVPRQTSDWHKVYDK